MTAEEFDLALAELGWKGTDFAKRTGIAPNSASRYRSGLQAVPKWAEEYLRAMLAIKQLHKEFVEPPRSTPPA